MSSPATSFKVLIVTSDAGYAEAIARFLRLDAKLNPGQIRIIDSSHSRDSIDQANYFFIDHTPGMDGRDFCNRFGITFDRCICIARCGYQAYCTRHLSLNDPSTRMGVVRMIMQSRQKAFA
jgi:hypothetical protein